MPAMKTILLLSLVLIASCQAAEKGLNHRTPSQEVVVIAETPQSANQSIEEAEVKGPKEDLPPVTNEFMELVNDHREKMGLRRLAYSKDIEITAAIHSRRMAQKRVPFGHMGSKIRCYYVTQAMEVRPGSLCGENVAMGQEDAKEVFSAWMNSPSHREAIEDGRYTHSGLGIHEDFRGLLYWTQIFVKVN